MKLPRFLRPRRELLRELAEQQEVAHRRYFELVYMRASVEVLTHEVNEAVAEVVQLKKQIKALEELIEARERE